MNVVMYLLRKCSYRYLTYIKSTQNKKNIDANIVCIGKDNKSIVVVLTYSPPLKFSLSLSLNAAQGVETSVSLEDKNKDEVLAALEKMATKDSQVL